MTYIKKFYNFVFWPYPWKQFQFFLWLFVFTFGLYMVHRFGHGYEWLTDRWFHYTSEIKAGRQYSPLPTLPSRAVLPFGIFVFSVIGLYLIWWKQKYLIRLLFFISVYTQFVDLASAFTLNKYYTVFFFLAALSYVYVDKVDNLKKISARPVRIMQLTFLIQYFTAGTCKVKHWDRLVHQDVLWTQMQWLYCNNVCACLLRITPKWYRQYFEYLTLGFEIWAPLLLLISYLHHKLVPLKWIVFIIGMWFHLFIAISMKNLIYFSQQLMVMYILFLSASEFDFITNVLSKVSHRVKSMFTWSFID